MRCGVALATGLLFTSMLYGAAASGPASSAASPSGYGFAEGYKITGTTIVFFSGRATDEVMAVLDTHPELTTVLFEATPFSVAMPGGGSGDGISAFRITDAGFAHIAKLTHLETLAFDRRQPLKISDDALQVLKPLKLKTLDLGGTPFTAKALEQLPADTLTNFAADACPVSTVIAAAARCPHLRVLTLMPHSVAYFGSGGSIYRKMGDKNMPTDKDLAPLAGLTELEELYADDSPLTDACAPTLAKLTKLKVLHVQGSQLTDAGIAQLAKLTGLEELNLNGTPITDQAMETIGGFQALQALLISNTQITDEGLRRLPKMPNLETIYLRSTKITDAGFADLGRFPKLSFLDLGATQIHDAKLRSLDKRPAPR